ncbi:MAG: response regulator transcription factor [Thermoguttaceae bacterium]
MASKELGLVTRVLIAGDQPVLRFGLHRLFSQESGLQVCGEVDESDKLFQQMEQVCPDLVVLGLTLDGRAYVGLIERLKTDYPETCILVGTYRNDAQLAARILQAGANGHVYWGESIIAIVEAVRTVLRGEIRAGTPIVRRLLQRVADGQPLDNDPARVLSPRELDVFTMIGQGFTTLQISRRLDLSPRTIETHRKNIKMKLELATISQLNRCAFQWVAMHSQRA